MIAAPVREIVLNAIELEVAEGHVLLPDGELRVAELAFDEGAERMTMSLDQRAGRRAGRPRPALQRGPQRPARRLLPLGIHRRGRDGAHDRDEPAGADRGAARVPLLRRAGVQSHVRGHPRRPRRARGLLQLPRRVRDGSARRAARGGLRDHHDDVVLPRRPRRRTARVDRGGRRRRRAARGRLHAGQGATGPVRPRDRGLLAPVLLPVLRHRVPRGEAGPRRRARLRLRRDGERRLHHLPRDRPPRGRGDARRATTCSGSPRSSPTRSRTSGSGTS